MNNEHVSNTDDVSDNETLSILIGKDVTGIAFIMDYFQLQFDDGYITIINPWELRLDNERYSDQSPCYHDALCEGITHKVINISVEKGRSLRIALENNWSLEIMLGDQDYQFGPEGVIFMAGDRWNVW